MEGDGRERRLEEWVARYGDAVLRMCYLTLLDMREAEDAAQETFLRAWRFMDRYKGRGEKTWLMHIALNDCRAIHRSRLPEKYRQVLLLYYYQDMTLEESAAALGLSRSTAHHRLKRAEAVLRDALTGGDGDEE